MSSDLTSSHFLYRGTDRQTDRQKAMHMSPPCISTCGLNKVKAVILISAERRTKKSIVPGLGLSRSLKHNVSLLHSLPDFCFCLNLLKDGHLDMATCIGYFQKGIRWLIVAETIHQPVMSDPYGVIVALRLFPGSVKYTLGLFHLKSSENFLRGGGGCIIWNWGTGVGKADNGVGVW